MSGFCRRYNVNQSYNMLFLEYILIESNGTDCSSMITHHVPIAASLLHKILNYIIMIITKIIIFKYTLC